MKRNYFLKGKISFRLTRMRRKARNRLVNERLCMHIRTANTMTMTTTWHQWIPACSRESFQESKLFLLPPFFRPQSSSSTLHHLVFLQLYLFFMRPPHPHSHTTTTLYGKNILCRVATGDEQKIAVNKSEKGHERSFSVSDVTLPFFRPLCACTIYKLFFEAISCILISSHTFFFVLLVNNAYVLRMIVCTFTVESLAEEVWHDEHFEQTSTWMTAILGGFSAPSLVFVKRNSVGGGGSAGCKLGINLHENKARHTHTHTNAGTKNKYLDEKKSTMASAG